MTEGLHAMHLLELIDRLSGSRTDDLTVEIRERIRRIEQRLDEYRSPKMLREGIRLEIEGRDTEEPAAFKGTNSGHGHVWERPDGAKARCGGPGLCAQCSRDQKLAEGAAR